MLSRCTWGRGLEGTMAPASLSSRFQSFTLIPTMKLGPSGAGSRVGGPLHTLGPSGSLQRPLLWGWESLLLSAQPPGAFSIRGLRLYFPRAVAQGCAVCFAPRRPVHLCANVGLQAATRRSACPALRHSESSPLGLSVCECGADGSASARTACPGRPTLRQSRSCHSYASPLHPGARLRPSYRSRWMFIFYFLGVGPPCHLILCQFCLCEEAQCVYLRRHLGSPYSFLIYAFGVINFPQSIAFLISHQF